MFIGSEYFHVLLFLLGLRPIWFQVVSKKFKGFVGIGILGLERMIGS